jgi:hypothetical protein
VAGKGRQRWFEDPRSRPDVTASVPHKWCKESSGAQAAPEEGRPPAPVPQPSRSLLPLRVIRATPCAPLPPQRVSRLPLRYVGRPGLLGTARRGSAGSSPPVGPSRGLLHPPAAGSPRAGPQRRGAGGAPAAGQPERLCGARRLAPELRRFGSVGCNRGVSGSLRVPALRSRVSARNSMECAVAR